MHGGDLEIGRTGNLAYRDRHAVKVGVMDVAPVQDIRQGPADQFADPQLPLCRSGPWTGASLCHAGDLGAFAVYRNGGLFGAGGTG